MSITVFHSLTATTPDNTQYEIRPSHWNSNHVVSLSLGGSDISNAFTNSPTVTFGSSGAYVTASVNTNYAATNITTNAIALSNSSLFQQTSATSAITSAAFANSNSSLLIAASNSSLFQQTSATSAITSNAFATSNSSLLVATSNSSLFQQTSATSAITSAAFPSAQTTKFAGTGTTFSGTNVSGSMTLNSNGLNLALSAGAGGGGSFSAGISTGGNTSGNTGTVSNQIVFVGGNNVTLSGSTAAGGATVTISGANIGGAQTGISGIGAGTQTQTSGTVVFSNSGAGNIAFGLSNGTITASVTGAYLTTAMQSNAGSNFLGTNTALTANGVSVTANSSGLSLNFPAFLTTAAQSSASNVSQIIAATNSTGGGTSTLTGGVTFGNSNGLTHYITNGSLVANYTVPTVPTSYVSNVNGSSGAVSVAGTGFTSTTTGGTAVVATLNTAGLSMGVPAYITTYAAQTNQSVGVYASSQTTGQSSSSTFDARSMTFVGAGGVSIGASNGSIIFSGATGGGGGGGGIALAASNTTFTSGTVVMSAAGGALTISSGAQSVLMSVPQTSSVVAGSGVALSTNGSTIYLYNDFHDIFVPNMVGASTTFNHGTSTGGNGTIQFVPLYPVDNYSFTCFDINISIPVTSTAVATYSGGETMSYALYQMDTANASRMTLVNSSSMFIRMSMSSNLSGAYTVNFNNSATSYSSSSAGATAVITELAGRPVVLRMPFAGTLQAGEVYYLGFGQSNQTGGASVLLPPVRSYGVIPANTNQMGYIGPDTRGGTSNGMDFMGFVYSTTSGAFPGTISTNQTQLNSSGFVPFVVFKNII